MGSFYYLFSIVALWLVIHWCMVNDGKSATTGLLEMKRGGTTKS